VLWTRQPLSGKAALGLLLGVIGVAVLVGWDSTQLGEGSGLAITAGVLAAACYGIASNYTRTAPSISSFDNAHGNMWAAVIIILPLLPVMPVREQPSPDMVMSVVALGVLCTGIAYLLYFKLITDVGAASALSVTFLIPAFGILWGYLILDEQVGWNTLAGTLLVLSGTMLVTGFSPRAILNRKLATDRLP
jgi:drug/metabolite transporter (DMT)-like permease